MLLQPLFRSKIFWCCISAALACCACRKPDEPTYRPGYTTRASGHARAESLRKRWDEVPRPALAITEDWRRGWRFTPGDSVEPLHTTVRPVPGDTVSLPHRLLQPNRALWYAKEVRIGMPGVISVKADDGAQLFINGLQQVRIHDHYFAVADTGLCEITVRVLNNAMSGGLLRVSFSRLADYRQFLERDEQ
jgi:hypothetical protein